ncbi:hypothetical protein RZO07_18435 [Pseudomonas protegens]|uniref:hypothetical protein n=1 Tax=Pseudomonas protegens TaxID=380021 RepID=UPI0029370426|nr:hypothetical protein [Pseudomonas protegens]WOE77308.1 hypothetical protein RZO07_18435 [Pseudomonas protegens]
MLSISHIQINPLLPQTAYKDFKINYAFGGNSSTISISNGNSGIGSEHWISENSELFLFSPDGNLVKFQLSTPNKNIKSTLSKKSSYWGEITLKNPKPFLLEPTKLRCFSAKRKELICLNSPLSSDVDYIYIKKDFSFIFSENNYCGYRLKNPLRYLCESVDENLGLIKEPNHAEYCLMEKYLSIMSDNRLDELNQNMELLVLELSKKISPHLISIRCDRRRKVIEKSITELLDFYL